MPAATPAEVHTLSVADEDGIGVDMHRGIALRELLGRSPVRGGAAAVEQAGLREKHRAGAHRRHPPAPARRAAHPGDHSAVARRFVHTPTAGDEKRVDRAGDFGQRPLRQHRDAG